MVEKETNFLFKKKFESKDKLKDYLVSIIEKTGLSTFDPTNKTFATMPVEELVKINFGSLNEENQKKIKKYLESCPSDKIVSEENLNNDSMSNKSFEFYYEYDRKDLINELLIFTNNQTKHSSEIKKLVSSKIDKLLNFSKYEDILDNNKEKYSIVRLCHCLYGCFLPDFSKKLLLGDIKNFLEHKKIDVRDMDTAFGTRFVHKLSDDFKNMDGKTIEDELDNLEDRISDAIDKKETKEIKTTLHDYEINETDTNMIRKILEEMFCFEYLFDFIADFMYELDLNDEDAYYSSSESEDSNLSKEDDELSEEDNLSKDGNDDDSSEEVIVYEKNDNLSEEANLSMDADLIKEALSK